MRQGRYTLWGTPHSLYTGKARSYLIKKEIPFVEVMSSDRRFLDEVIPKIGLKVIPVVETPSGEIIQDTTEIIDYCEEHEAGPRLHPEGGVQGVVAHLLDAFGSNYLLPLAMHYRWSYRAEQEQFLQAEFARATPGTLPYASRLENATKLMGKFASFLPNLGVRDDVTVAMEESFKELLSALEEHFRCHPYLLGGRPSRADFGMMAPLYAHLCRDPVPAFLVRTTAPNVARWTERMNVVAIPDPDYPGSGADYSPGDTLPKTLEAVLRIVFAHWEPGLRADAAQFDSWLGGLTDPAAGLLVSHDGRRQVHPHVGRIEYAWRGVTITRTSQPYSLWHIARAQSAARSLSGDAGNRLGDLLDRTGGARMMALKTARQIVRKDNVLVLG